MDSCDGYGRSRKHGAFSCEQGTAVCGKWRPYFDLLCIEIYGFMQRKHRVMLLLFCPLRCI